MNDKAEPAVQYKVLYLGRHGEGFHNVAESWYGTDAWDVRPPSPLPQVQTPQNTDKRKVLLVPPKRQRDINLVRRTTDRSRESASPNRT